VVGQKIALTASLPAGATLDSQPWLVTGTTVGGYVLSPNVPRASGPTAKVIEVDLAHETTTFYWIVPGDFLVTLSCTLANGQSALVEAFFDVSGPTSANVSTQMAAMANIGYKGSIPYLVLGNPTSTPPMQGITFTASANIPFTVAGQFLWAQLVDDSHALEESGNLQRTGTTAAGGELDNTFPYVSQGVPNDTVFDSPNWRLPSPSQDPYTHIIFSFSARMFLMWESTLPSSCDQTGLCTFIPVPLGFTSWNFSATADLGLFGWQASAESGGNPIFQLSNGYPIWSSVAHNGDLSCVLPQPSPR
jgi:hypothetical protein